MLPPDPGSYRNAANGYGGRDYDDRSPDFDEEAAAMRYDPQTNTGAAIRAYISALNKIVYEEQN